MSLRASVFIAASLDGYIARRDGGIEWLGAGEEGEDFGFRVFYDSVDALAMGRNTFEKVLSFPEWPYSGKRLIVLTSRPLELPSVHKEDVEVSGETPLALRKRLASDGVKRVYVDGGVTIQRFLREDALDDLTVTWIPILLGEGIPLFGPTGRDIPLRLVGAKPFPNGYLQTTHEIAKL